MSPRTSPLLVAVIAVGLASSASRLCGDDAGKEAPSESLRLAIVDLIETFGANYPQGPEFLKRCDELEKSSARVMKRLLRNWLSCGTPHCWRIRCWSSSNSYC